MKSYVVLSVFAALCFVQYVTADDDKYTTKYDNINIDEVLNNKRLLKSYVDCAMERGTCSQDMLNIKEAIIESLQNECKKCSDVQKERAKKVFKHLIEKEAETFKEIETKYDPDHKYRKQYEATAKEHGITFP